MRTSVTYKEIWNITYPIILGYIVQNIITLTDTAFLGHVGEIELGASAIGGLFYILIIMLGYGFSIGAQIITARRCGERNYTKIGKTIEHSLYFLIFIALIVILLINPFIPNILTNILKSQDVLIATKIFLGVRIYGLFFAYLNFGFRAFYIGIAKTKIITYTTILMAISNIFFDYVLVFGHLGFPKLGIGGAALASVISEIIATVFFVVYTIKFIDLKFYNLFSFKKIDLGELQQILKVAFPMMIQNLVAIIGWFLFFIFIEKMGAHSLAISNIVRSIYVVTLIPMWGFASATNTLVSNLMEQNREQEIIPLIFKIASSAVLGLLILVFFNLIIPEKIISIYTNDFYLVQETIPVLFIVSIGAFFMTFGFILFNGVSGTGMTKVSLFIESAVMMIYIIGTYTLVNMPNTQIQYIWTIEIMYGTLLGVISYFYLKSGKWQLNKI